MNSIEVQILQSAKVIALVGLSNKPERDSYKVAAYLQAQSYRILPINPSQAGHYILNEICYSNLLEAKAATGAIIDIVDCFRKSEDILSIAKESIDVGAKCLWMQLGVINQEAARIAEHAGLIVVMDKCTKIEHKK